MMALITSKHTPIDAWLLVIMQAMIANTFTEIRISQL
jgi:hypothetical protein